MNDLGQLEHVLFEPAGDHEGLHEEHRAGKQLCYFVEHPNAAKAQLSEAHVVALRWYTTDAYKSINAPLHVRSHDTSDG